MSHDTPSQHQIKATRELRNAIIGPDHSDKINIESMKLALTHGANPNLKLEDANGRLFVSLLSQVIYKKDDPNTQEALDILVAAGANIEDTDGIGLTALNISAWNCSIVAAKQLIKHGAKVDTISKFQDTPLHTIVSCATNPFNNLPIGHAIEFIQMLLDAKTTALESTNHIAETPLCIAAKKCHVQIAKYLLDHGASINATTSYGYTVLSEAVAFGTKPYARHNITGPGVAEPLKQALEFIALSLNYNPTLETINTAITQYTQGVYLSSMGFARTPATELENMKQIKTILDAKAAQIELPGDLEGTPVATSGDDLSNSNINPNAVDLLAQQVYDTHLDNVS